MVTVPPYPKDLALPPKFSFWRPHQRDCIQRIVNSNKRYFLLCAPTGSGKSLTAMAAGRITGEVTALTATIALQYQYARDFQVETPIGKGNFRCTATPKIRASDMDCGFGENVCPLKFEGCEYYDQLRRAEKAKARVLNYALQYYCANFSDFFKETKLMVCDEGHDLESVLVGMESINLSKKKLEKIDVELPENLSLRRWQDWAHGVHEAVIQRAKAHEIVNPRSDIMAQASAVGKLAGFLRGPWVPQSTDKGLTVRPLWAFGFAEPNLFSYGDRIVIMSATLFAPDMTAFLLGIPEGEYEYLEVPSTFDPARRPLIYQPIANMNRSAPDGAWEAVANYCDNLIDAYWPTKMIIHTVSYPRAEQLKSLMRYGKIVQTHGKTLKDREKALAEFIQSPAQVIASPSLMEGVDLPDDLLRVQVIPKIPWGDLSDPVVRARKAEHRRVYEYEALSKVIQAYGRGCRHEGDWAHTYILDKDFDRLLYGARTWIPQWVAEAIVRR